MDELVDLSVKFDLSYSAPSPLEIEAGTEGLSLCIMIADPEGNRLDFADRAEIKAAAPDEWMDSFEEIAAKSPIAGYAAGTDKGRPLPG